MINGWWGMALCGAGRREEAKELCGAVTDFNRKNRESEDGWGFYEYGHALTGEPGGVRQCSWSAAGLVLLECALQGPPPYFG